MSTQATAGYDNVTLSDEDFNAFQQQVVFHFRKHSDRPLFRASTWLWEAYLSSFEEPGMRQLHTCSTCQDFMGHYGNLVYVDDSGRLHSAVFPDTLPEVTSESGSRINMYAEVSAKLAHRVAHSTIKSAFFVDPDQLTLGHPTTMDGYFWNHLYVDLRMGGTLPCQAQVKPHEVENRVNMVTRATTLFSLSAARKAVALLKSSSVLRSDRFLNPAQWFLDLKEAVGGPATKHARNLIWNAVYSAPEGFCHVQNSMVGELMFDIQSGAFTDEAIIRKFNVKADPLFYQRPQAAPKAGNIVRAEKLIAELGLESSLSRRYATFAEIKGQMFWLPKEKAPAKQDGVFGHLKKSAKEDSLVETSNTVTMTWDKFKRTVLPEASAVHYVHPKTMNTPSAICAFLTATNPDAPPILAWDVPDKRNPVSLYFHAPQTKADWNFSSLNRRIRVLGICPQPSSWGYERPLPQYGYGDVLILEGVYDTVNGVGLCLFPEILKTSLREVSSTIEAHSNSQPVDGSPSTGVAGLAMTPIPNGSSYAYGLLEVEANGVLTKYQIDRWD